MKKLFAFLVGFGLALGYSVSAAPTTTYQRNLMPETTQTYDLGTSTKKWRTVTTDGLCMGGSCTYTLPNGSQWTTTSTGIFYNGGRVGIGTSSPDSALSVNGLSHFTNTIKSNGLVFENQINSNLVGLYATTTASSYNIYLPDGQGLSGSFIKNDGNGVTSWGFPAVDSIATYYAYINSSSPNTYLSLSSTVPLGTSQIQHVTTTLTAASTSIKAWLSPSSTPGTTLIPAGVWQVHLDAFLSSVGTKAVTIYADIFKVSSTSVETSLGQTDRSAQIRATDPLVGEEIFLSLYLPPTELLATDRIGFRIYALQAGSGTNNTLVLNIEDNTIAGITLPKITTDLSLFVPFTNANKNVDLGTNNISAGNAYITSNVGIGTTTVAATDKLAIWNGSNGASGLRVTAANSGSATEGFIAVANNSTNGYLAQEVFSSGWGTASLQNSGTFTAGAGLTNGMGFLTLANAPINFSTAGVGNVRLTITGAGLVGLNSSTPIAQLSSQTAAGNIPMDIASSTGSSMFRIGKTGNVIIGIPSGVPTNAARVVYRGDGGDIVAYENSSGVRQWTVPDSGNATLAGSLRINASQLINGGAGDMLYYGITAGSNNVMLANASTSVALVVGGPSAANGPQKADYFQIRSQYNVANADIMVVSSSGNVGIGTNAPFAKLSIGSGSLLDNNVPIQMNAAAGGEANYGVNKGGSYGFLFGYKNTQAGYPGLGPFGYLRVVPNDPFTIMVANTQVSTLWSRFNDVVLGGNISNSSTFAGGTMVVKGTGQVSIATTTLFNEGFIVATTTWMQNGQIYGYRSSSAATVAVTKSDFYLSVSSTSNYATTTLPLANSVKAGTAFRIKDRNPNDSSIVRILSAYSDTIDLTPSTTPFDLPNGGATLLISDGVSNWEKN